MLVNYFLINWNKDFLAEEIFFHKYDKNKSKR